MIKWGSEMLFSIEVGKNHIHSIVPTGSGFYVACSNMHTFIFNRSAISYVLPDRFSALTYISEYDLIIASRAGISTLVGFYPLNPQDFPLNNYKIGQESISQIHYSFPAKSLITIGRYAKIWHFSVTRTNQLSSPHFSISYRATVPLKNKFGHNSEIIFDDKRERIYIPTQSGFELYSYDGNLIIAQNNMFSELLISIALLPCPLHGKEYHTVAGVPRNIYKRIFASSQSGQLLLWHRSGKLLRSFGNGGSSMIFSRFINSEFIICANRNSEIFAVDVKTGKIALILTLPSNVEYYNLYDNQLIAISNSTVHAYEINIPWKLWYRPIDSAKILRFTGGSCAHRVGLLSGAGSLTLLSARSCVEIGTLTTHLCATPISVVYERYFMEDYIIMVMDSGSIQSFEYNSEEFIYRNGKDLMAKDAVFFAFGKGQWALAIINSYGDLLVLDPFYYEQLRRLKLEKFALHSIFWDRRQNLLIVTGTKEIYIIDTYSLRILSSIERETPNFSAYHDGMLITASKLGKVGFFTVFQNTISFDCSFDFKTEILDLSYQFGIFILICSNKQIILGSHEKGKIASFEFLFQPISACFLNLQLEMLISLDSCIMHLEAGLLANVKPLLMQLDEIDEGKPDVGVKRQRARQKRVKEIIQVEEAVRPPKPPEDDYLKKIRLALIRDDIAAPIPIPNENQNRIQNQNLNKKKKIRKKSKMEENENKTEIKRGGYDELIKMKSHKCNIIIKESKPKIKEEKDDSEFEFVFNEDGTVRIRSKDGSDDPKLIKEPKDYKSEWPSGRKTLQIVPEVKSYLSEVRLNERVMDSTMANVSPYLVRRRSSCSDRTPCSSSLSSSMREHISPMPSSSACGTEVTSDESILYDENSDPQQNSDRPQISEENNRPSSILIDMDSISSSSSASDSFLDIEEPPSAKIPEKSQVEPIHGIDSSSYRKEFEQRLAQRRRSSMMAGDLHSSSYIDLFSDQPKPSEPPVEDSPRKKPCKSLPPPDEIDFDPQPPSPRYHRRKRLSVSSEDSNELRGTDSFSDLFQTSPGVTHQVSSPKKDSGWDSILFDEDDIEITPVTPKQNCHVKINESEIKKSETQKTSQKSNSTNRISDKNQISQKIEKNKKIESKGKFNPKPPAKPKKSSRKPIRQISRSEDPPKVISSSCQRLYDVSISREKFSRPKKVERKSKGLSVATVYVDSPAAFVCELPKPAQPHQIPKYQEEWIYSRKILINSENYKLATKSDPHIDLAKLLGANKAKVTKVSSLLNRSSQSKN